MKSLTGKFSSVRGWALLLALLLGAGMMISACGEEEVPAPTTPAPAPAPTPTPPPDPEPTGPATPENLRVTGRTSTTITWSWNAVEGALGYQGQFSTDATFTETDPTFIIVAPATSHTVSNLSGNMTGHFRVRSGTGTSLTDLTYSEWSDGVSGSTDAPPPAAALAAPDNVESSARNDDSITLEWDRVDDAATYEVEQREPGDDWGDAACGADDADNEVDDEECVASGLDSGTDYDFRVRGVPADDDDANLLGAWSETFEARTSGTAPRPTTPTVSGGMGDLGVTWKSTAATITFTWEPTTGTGYEWIVLEEYDDSPNPCGGTTFDSVPAANKGNQFSLTLGSDTALTAADVRGLCVRTDDKDNRALSFAWGVPTPGAATATQDTGVELNDESTVASALTWTRISLVGGFNWEARVVADPQRRPQFDVTEAAVLTGKEMQAACDAGSLAESGDTDVPYVLDEVAVRSGLTAYTGYSLCVRFSNTSGKTAWAVPGAKLFTHPARPARPSIDRVRSGDTSFVWQVTTRNNHNVPRENDDTDATTGFLAKTIVFDVTFPDPANSARNLTTATPSAKDCEAATAPTDRGTWTPGPAIAHDTIGTDSSGIVIRSGTIRANPASGEDKGLDKRVYLCVQAIDGGRKGPWNISAPETVKGIAPAG